MSWKLTQMLGSKQIFKVKQITAEQNKILQLNESLLFYFPALLSDEISFSSSSKSVFNRLVTKISVVTSRLFT